MIPIKINKPHANIRSVYRFKNTPVSCHKIMNQTISERGGKFKVSRAANNPIS